MIVTALVLVLLLGTGLCAAGTVRWDPIVIAIGAWLCGCCSGFAVAVMVAGGTLAELLS